jgi:hypothetical protein
MELPLVLQGSITMTTSPRSREQPGVASDAAAAPLMRAT